MSTWSTSCEGDRISVPSPTRRTCTAGLDMAPDTISGVMKRSGIRAAQVHGLGDANHRRVGHGPHLTRHWPSDPQISAVGVPSGCWGACRTVGKVVWVGRGADDQSVPARSDGPGSLTPRPGLEPTRTTPDCLSIA